MADEDAPLTPDEILTFGPAVEAQVWTPTFLAEARAPIAVSAGRPKFGPVFNSDGIGNAVIIRPCMSRGKRLRGLPPIYAPQMLEKHSGVFDGWPMFLDHVPPALAEKVAKHGRSVRELGGQVIRGRWDRQFVQEGDADFGYQRGGTLAEVWASPLVRNMVANNPNLLHTSINAWPTSGRPGPCPWRPAVKGMMIEGIRRQPQGSVDYVVRGGAGGKLLLEGAEDEGAWPEVGEWAEEDVRFVVSLAESFYASRRMGDLILPTEPSELQAWLQEHAPHLSPALGFQVNEADADEAAVARLMKGGMSMKAAWAKVKAGKGSDDDADDKGKGSVSESESAITIEDVQRLIQESTQGVPTVEEFEERLREQTERTIAEREAQRELADHARRLIESADGILPSWKRDLVARYSMQPDGAPATLMVAESDLAGDDGATLTERQVLEARVERELDHVRGLIAEAQGKPRPRGEGGARRDPGEDSGSGSRSRAAAHHWRSTFASMGLAENADAAVKLFGNKVEG